MTANPLTFLKLGGSLITDKGQRSTPRPSRLSSLAVELALVRQAEPGLRLVLGHGSGSFGHFPAQKYHTRQGVHSPAEWMGFAEVWKEARALNQIVLDALYKAGLPVVAFPPSACILAENGQIKTWNLEPLLATLEAGLIPVVMGDVAFDVQLGGTILSTEELFFYLARCLKPQRILLAGIENGVWADFPACTQLIPEITPANFAEIARLIGGSSNTDVTGGMLSKVQSMLSLVQEIPGLEASIFSGIEPGLLTQALTQTAPGTRIFAPV